MEEFEGEPPILLIGSNIRFLAENAVRHGHEVATVDYFGDRDTKKLCPNKSSKRDGDSSFDLNALISLAYSFENSGIVYGPGFENDIFALNKLGDVGRVYGCSVESVRKSRDPETLGRAARSWNFKYPAIRYEKNESMENGKWLAKTFSGMGGVGVQFVDKDYEPDEGGVYYQAHVDGLASSAIVVSNGSDASVLGIMTQIIGDETFGGDGFRYVGNIFPHPFAKESTAQVTAIADSLTLELDLKGLWGFDFIYNGEVTLVEVNPRPTAGLEAISMGTWNDLLGMHLDSVKGKHSNLIVDPGPQGQYFAHARVFAKEDVVFTGWEKWYKNGARDVPYDGEIILAGEPVLTVHASDTSYGEALVKLRHEAALVYSSLAPAVAPSI